MAVKIITDSACDLPEELIEKYGIEVMPILVYLNDKEYLDSVTLKSNELYEAMKSGARVTTAQIPIGYFMDRFEALKESEDTYIYLAFSSNLSGTYQTAVVAKETLMEVIPDLKLEIVDTKCASLGLGLIVIEAAKLAGDGADVSEIMAYIEEASRSMEHIFSVDDLEYLFRGGRVSRAQATLGNILNIKPIINIQDGFLIPIDKVKGKKKRLQKLYDYMADRGVRLDSQCIGIAHAASAVDAEEIKAYIETTFGTREIIISELGCAVGAHCGPGMISIFFRNKL